MRVYLFDDYEFESPSSEEMLHVLISHKRECPTAKSFLGRSQGERSRWVQPTAKQEAEAKRLRRRRRGMISPSPVDEYDPMPLVEHRYERRLRALERRFHCFPEPLEYYTVIAEMHSSPNTPISMELLLESERRFIWYKWFSTA